MNSSGYGLPNSKLRLFSHTLHLYFKGNVRMPLVSCFSVGAKVTDIIFWIVVHMGCKSHPRKLVARLDLQGPFMFTKLCYDVDQATFTVDSGPTQYQSRPICWVW